MTPSGPGAVGHGALRLKGGGTDLGEEAVARPGRCAAKQEREFGIGGASLERF